MPTDDEVFEFDGGREIRWSNPGKVYCYWPSATLSYLVQGARTVTRPREKRPFVIGYSVKSPAAVRLTISRSGKTYRAWPRKGTVVQSGALERRVPGIRRGLYRLRLEANSDRKEQKQCPTQTLRVRR